jgi:hypothetical protein
MPAELRELVKREAKLNGRSLNAEILTRLRASIDPQRRSGGSRTTAPERNGWVPTDAERAMLAVFRKLPPEKQLALLSLFE